LAALSYNFTASSFYYFPITWPEPTKKFYTKFTELTLIDWSRDHS